MTTATTSREFFERMYRADVDPWKFASSDYEQSRYAATMRAFEGRRYNRAFEPGCSVGVLTEQLAAVCGRVEAMDISPAAVEQARERCKNLSNVEICSGALPEAVPNGSFDLIVFSEIGYYFEEDTLRALGAALVHRLEPHGALLAVHWLGYSPDHVLQGERVQEILGALEGLTLEVSERHGGTGHGSAGSDASFRLDRWVRR